MKNIVKILLAVFVLSQTPSIYICAQGHIETPAERKARQEREAAAKKKKPMKPSTWVVIEPLLIDTFIMSEGQVPDII